MGVKSVLDKLGEDAKDVLNFLGSAKGQAVVSTTEAAIESFVPGSAGAITLINNWTAQILMTQALATAAGAQTGSDEQKATVTLAAISSQAASFLAANGLPAPTAAQLSAANAALVAFWNSLGVVEST